MKVLEHRIFRTDASRSDNDNSNVGVKAHRKRNSKLFQLGLDTILVAIKLPMMIKSVTFLEETETSTERATRGMMGLRVIQRLHMNVGEPNSEELPP